MARASSSPFTITVEGLPELRRDLQRASDRFPREMRGANKEAAEVVADDARGRARVGATGRLRGSIKAQASTRSAYVKGGTAARVPYFAVHEFGWPAHNIEPQGMIYPAIAAKNDEVVEKYDELLWDILNNVF